MIQGQNNSQLFYTVFRLRHYIIWITRIMTEVFFKNSIIKTCRKTNTQNNELCLVDKHKSYIIFVKKKKVKDCKLNNYPFKNDTMTPIFILKLSLCLYIYLKENINMFEKTYQKLSEYKTIF